MRWPNGSKTRPTITSPFGKRAAPVAGASTLHKGTDFIGYATVRAVAAGVVVRVGTPAGWSGGGVQVWIQHDGFLSRSMHLSTGSPVVKVGQGVAEGDPLGVMGKTGNVSGVHHHLEIVVNNVQVDPVPFITARLATAAGNSNTPTNSGGSTAKEWDEMASKDEIKSALFEVLSSRPDAVVIHSSYEGRNGIYLAAPGFWHQFTAEQWKQFKDHGMYSAVRELIPVNARDFDVFKEIYAPKAAQAAPAVLTDAQLAQIIAQINTTTSADLDAADLDRIAKAVRAQFAADPLTLTAKAS
ncbi:M23 family metallopeptidase [Microbacterium maritypicum]|uniref:M23 family metallopeptidase n=1 Tax=Microbacterium maritypicum TaxID=33918 RepID=UPI00382CB32B